ncbi:hypothetical protein [Rhizobium sp. BK399]|uniref:hypothetical protein n=1 Tax=Rhizobium sp. BK399 TaxID=2587063 RepID=UPI00180D8A47|nr:hypothetical protein [Rhizobium sp. BK399]
MAATAAVTVITGVVEAVAASVAGADVDDADEASSSAVPTLAAENLRIGALDVSLAPETGSVTSGAAERADSSDVVAIGVEGSGGRTVRGFAVVCGSGVEELVVDAPAVVSAKLAPPVVSPVEGAPEAGDICDVAGSLVRGDAVVCAPVSELTEPTAFTSVIGGAPVEEPTVAFARRALPVTAAL